MHKYRFMLIDYTVLNSPVRAAVLTSLDSAVRTDSCIKCRNSCLLLPFFTAYNTCLNWCLWLRRRMSWLGVHWCH